MTRKPSWFSLVLALSLVLTGPATVFAQDSADDENNANKLYFPYLYSSTQADVSTTEEIEDDEAPAITTIQAPKAAMQVAASAVTSRELPQSLAALRLAAQSTFEPVQTQPKLNPTLRAATGKRQVIVRLREPSVAEQVALNVSASGVDAQLAQLARVEVQQTDVVQAATALDANAKVLAQAQKAINVVILEVDAAALASLAANPAVTSINPVVDYQLALTETVPYIGATAVQQAGYTGKGVKVAVLDSGVDYLHAHFGGSGNPADYASNDPTIVETGTFPTARVVGGFDFVGSEWVGGRNSPPEKPDPDPLDDGPQRGHGTHVADIIGGAKGVAPEVDLFAVKVCSSASTACSNIALIQAMDFVLDPNDDGDMSDRMDIVNMSLGQDYGIAFDDDLSLAVDNASALGVLTVAAAGNGGDKPYVAGTPAAALSALSVAQTHVPSAIGPALQVISPTAIAGLYEAVFQSWSAPLTRTVEAPVQYGDGAGGNPRGCDPFATGSLNGKIVLVDRGVCDLSLKISNIAAGGGLIGVVGLVAPGDPFVFGLGEGNPTIPGYNVSQATATRIKLALARGEAVIARFDPASGVPLVGHMVGSSGRGPSMGTNIIKPEIGAPGASVSAVAGSGTGVSPFGGTSGATPMVAGAAALLLQKYPERSPAELKVLLMNTGDINIMNKPAIFNGNLAAITRIGGGEVRVDRALNATAAAWNATAPTAALSFSFHDITRTKKVLKQVVNIRNYSDHHIRYEISPTFRFATDAASGAIEINTPDDILVRAHSDRQFEVTMIIRGEKLPTWLMNSGSLGANPTALTLMEFDGYITLIDEDDATNQLRLPWHVLPRKAGDVSLKDKDDYIRVRNRGVATTTVEAYSLIGVSDNLPAGGPGQNKPTPDLRYVGYSTFGVPAGVCSEQNSFVLGFAFNSWERQSHAVLPASFEVDLDINRDGTADYAVFSFDASLSGSLSDGRNLAWVQNLATGDAIASFFTDHDTNSGNTVLLFCAEDIGLTLADLGKPIDVVATVFDIWAGVYSDAIEGITIAPGGERYVGLFDVGGVGATVLGYKTNDKLRILDTGSTTNNTESGLLLLYRGGTPEGKEAGVVIVTSDPD